MIARRPQPRHTLPQQDRGGHQRSLSKPRRPVETLLTPFSAYRNRAYSTGSRAQLQRHVRDQPQCPIRTDEQLHHVVAGDVLHDRAAHADHATVRQCYCQGLYQIAYASIAHPQRRVERRRHDPAHCGLGPWRDQRNPHAIPCQLGLQIREACAGADRDVQIVTSVGADPVEQCRAQRHIPLGEDA